MDALLKKQYAGFRLNETLMTNLKFSGIFKVWEIEQRARISPDEQTDYWVIKDEYGARLSCFDRKLVDTLSINEKYEVKGEIKIGKGGTFLNLKEAEVLNGKNFFIV